MLMYFLSCHPYRLTAMGQAGLSSSSLTLKVAKLHSHPPGSAQLPSHMSLIISKLSCKSLLFQLLRPSHPSISFHFCLPSVYPTHHAPRLPPPSSPLTPPLPKELPLPITNLSSPPDHFMRFSLASGPPGL